MKTSKQVELLEKQLLRAETTLDKIWDRTNGSDADEKTYWAVLGVIKKYRTNK